MKNEERLIARIRELSNDTLDGAIERGHILKTLNLAWHEYDSKKLGITFQTGYRLIALVDHPRMQRDDWQRPAQWTVCHEVLQLTERCFDAMLSAGFVNYHTTRRQVRDFVKTWKRRHVVKCEPPRIDTGVDKISIFNEDCLTGMTRIPDGSVDLILADLPYQVTENSWDEIISLEPLWKHYKRIIKPTGVIVLTAAQPFTTTLVSSNLSWFGYEWIWLKNLPTGHLNAHQRPMRLHESVLVFSSCASSTYNAQGLRPLGKVVTRGHNGSNFNDSGKANYQEWTNYPTTILQYDFDKDEDKLHPTQKPVTLFEYLVRTYTNAGELVLDNCMGSGTTGVACINADRRFIGFEINPEYFAAAKDRIEHHTAKQTDLLANLFES